jgi:hypothetical protein
MISFNNFSDSSLHNHILRFHHELNSKSNPSSCFFNLSNSLSEKVVIDKNSKKKTFQNDASMSSASSFSKLTNGLDQNAIKNSSNDLFIYQCVNCRLYFTSNSSFSHNCLISVVDKQPPTYFSPIYLKFNLSNFVTNAKNSFNSSNNTFQVIQSNVINSQNNNNSDHLTLNVKRIKMDTSNQFSSNQINV